MTETKNYCFCCVVAIIEHLRDGVEHSAKLFGSTEAALEWIDRMENSFAAGNKEFALLAVGPQIAVRAVSVSRPQPPIVKVKHVLDEVRPAS